MNHAAPGALRRRLIASGLAGRGRRTRLHRMRLRRLRAVDRRRGSDDAVGVSLIVKTTTNPFFVAMQDGAEAAAEKLGVELTLAAGKEDGDEDTPDPGRSRTPSPRATPAS